MLTLVAKSQVIDVSDGEMNGLNISGQMQVFEDSTGRLDIHGIEDQHFKLNRKDDFIFPFTSSTFWVRLELINSSSDNENWILHWDNPTLEKLTYYEYSSVTDAFEIKQVSTLSDEKDYTLYTQEPTFKFELSKGSRKVIYLLLDSRRSHYGRLKVYSSMAYNAYSFDDFGRQSFLNGLLIFRLLLILIISFFVINDKMFRAYSAVILFKTIGFWGLGNVTGPIFSNDPLVIAKIDQLVYGIAPLSLLFFALKTLPVHKVSHWLARFGYTLLVIALVVNLTITLDYQWYWIKAGMSLTVLSGVFTLLLYAYFALKRQNIHKYYSIPLLLGLVSNMLIMSRLLLHIDFEGIFALAFFMFAAEILTFIIFLGQIFKQVERRKFNAEQNLAWEADQNRKLQELDKLKTSFFTNISHELRTPLTLMHGPSQELVKKYPGERLMGLLSNNLSKLRNLVDELLDIQKLEVNKMTPEISKADISAQLRLLVFSFQSLAESKKIKLKLGQNEEVFFGHYDTKMFVKIMNNLLSNALKFTPEGGQIEVRADYTSKPEQICLNVHNTGSVITKEDLPHIFERFYQADHSPYEGTGIGLALVKELVDVLQGSITAESKEETGTTFRISLPLALDDWSEYTIGNKEPMEFELPSNGSITSITNQVVTNEEKLNDKELILLVEDNSEMREYIGILLSEEYNLIEAENGAEGLVKANEMVPDLIICDAMMPVMDGYAFSKAIKEEQATSHVPIVMLTAKASTESKIESYELGVDNYLTKPFDARELRSVLSALKANRKKMQEVFSKEIFDLKPNQIVVSSKETQFLGDLKDFLEGHFHRSDLIVTDIAAHLKMSDTQLRRKLKSISGYSPNGYLRKFRMERAAQLLRANARSVSQVAYDVGFENLSYFSKAFHSEYGCSPSAYSTQD